MKRKRLKDIGVIKAFCIVNSLVKIVIDVSDTDKNREWMRDFKKRWKEKLEQLELWLVSYTIDVD